MSARIRFTSSLGVIIFALALVRCVSTERRVDPPPRPPGPPPSSESAALRQPLRVSLQPRGTVANSGVLLPVISPDGKRIAYLRTDAGAAIGSDHMLSGEGLGGVSLYVARVDGERAPRGVIPRGAAWPVWSPSGDRLACIAYDKAAKASLVIHELKTGATQSVALPLDRMFQPVFSPDGGRIALAAQSGNSSRSSVYLIDTTDMSVQPGPKPRPGATQLAPAWIDAGRLAFVSIREGDAELRRWPLRSGGGGASERIAPLNLIPAAPAGVLRAFAGIAGPISPDGDWLAYYDAAADRIALIAMSNGYRRTLPPRTRAGCWLGPGLFAAATDDTLALHPASGGPGRTLLEQRALPRWGRLDSGGLLVCTPGDTPRILQLMRVRIRGIR